MSGYKKAPSNILNAFLNLCTSLIDYCNDICIIYIIDASYRSVLYASDADLWIGWIADRNDGNLCRQVDMHKSNRTNPLALQVFIFVVLLVRNIAGTNPKNKTTCMDTCDRRRYETTHAQVEAKHDKFFSTLGVPCPPPGFLCLICDLNIGINLSCDARAYIMDFCYRNNPKAYIIGQSFYECEKSCPDSVCMQMLLFKKWGLSENFLNTDGSINIMNNKDCFFEEPFDNVAKKTTEHAVQKPFEIALTIICLTLSSLTTIVYLSYVIYLLARNRINRFGKTSWRQTKEFKTENLVEVSDLTFLTHYEIE
ncbi:hypothetical protein CHS0354_034559 [Potamilus streckersoni]|uniref:Uncharacterized protein n=1 Tax=Potamilus streckersoni TaxID=2493646 RepID=A0AAE0SUF4_9BIVA|nr:hypothetical protein CHS0354_034559 [Potamilus streckersoni]